MSGLSLFDQPSWRCLVAALLHTLWQGPLIALLLAFTLRRLRADRQETRYLLALAAQFSILAAGLATWSWLDRPDAAAVAARSVSSEAAEPNATPLIVVEPTTKKMREARPITVISESSWVPLLSIGWLTGVGLMLLKSAGSVLSAHRLSRGPRVTEPAIVSLLDRLREELRIRRPIRVVACEAIACPAVLGLIRPTLILPISLLTGLPPDAVRAILAHELAHIRRHDYAVNLLQMLIESLFFFNPTVWWLGRQVRIEREACCDALAVRVVGSPLAYSHALAEWAGVMSVLLGVPGWSGDGRTSTLLERIHRVLRPSERFGPQRISFTSLFVLLAIGPILLAILWRGTQAVVVLAAQALTPAQRVEKIEKEKEFHETGTNSSGLKTILQGTIRTPDGKPVSFPVPLWLSWDNGNGSGSTRRVGHVKGSFSVEAGGSGSAFLMVDSKTHAPKIVGPIKTEGGKTVDDIAIDLDLGFPYHFRLIDEEGMPIVRALIKANPLYGRNDSWIESDTSWTTNANGIATIEHAAAQPYGLSITAPGYQLPTTAFRMTPIPGATLTLRLPRYRETRGVVVDRKGRPVADATIWLLAEKRDDLDEGVFSFGNNWPQVGRTNAEGRFRIDTLRDKHQYHLLVESRTKERGIIPDVRTGQVGLRGVVTPCPTLEGQITDDLKSLDQDDGVPVIGVTQFVPAEFGRIEVRHPQVSVDPNGRFKLEGLIPGQVTIQAGKRTLHFPIPEEEGSSVVDLNQQRTEPAARRIVLQIVTTDGATRLSGALKISYGTGDSEFGQEVELQDGRATFDAPVGSAVSYRIDRLTGHWFPNGELTVKPGQGELKFDIKAFPAGAIRGRLFGSDGKPCAASKFVAWKVLERTSSLRELPVGIQIVGLLNDRFSISPLPLGATYVVYGLGSLTTQPSQSIRLDEVSPTGDIEIRYPPTTGATVRILGPAGRPVPNAPVALALDDPVLGLNFMQPLLTDNDGRTSFNDLVAGREGYFVRLDFRSDYLPTKGPLHLDGSLTEIQVQSGKRLEGRIVDASSGRPIPDVEMFATGDAPGDASGSHRFESESVTDGDGRFRFSNLPDQAVKLNDGSGLKWESPTSREVLPDKNPPIVIRATQPNSIQFKPSPSKN